MRPTGRTGILMGLSQCEIKKSHYACFVNELSGNYQGTEIAQRERFRMETN